MTDVHCTHLDLAQDLCWLFIFPISGDFASLITRSLLVHSSYIPLTGSGIWISHSPTILYKSMNHDYTKKRCVYNLQSSECETIIVVVIYKCMHIVVQKLDGRLNSVNICFLKNLYVQNSCYQFTQTWTKIYNIRKLLVKMPFPEMLLKFT